ncbi:pimeloyl-ACP methyl ester carboxylesterase [Methylobacterium aerolatum]|uniref:Pimeloyl-ACP methyl ester carboxylesterase n=2 Tax=Methylobacterium aerolatum TaxID=418708 RepID=A0ABU0HY01_9HYPH|nr:alpha/beta hydrolase [Methylobacterium aerolatum]MDQ0447186.1 pimeloyl-ACP methyl ester carboxylesterase [Methylobacterium aerolatum]
MTAFVVLLSLPVLAVAAVLALGAVASLIITLRVGAQHPPEGPFVAVPGGRLATIQAGPADGPPVVLLHGASANASDPMEGVGRLIASRGYRVIAFDRPGFGWSDRPGGGADADPAAQARLIAAALETMGVGPAIVLGHSWAGALALALALDHPERVSGLVLAAGVGMPMPGPITLPWYWNLALKPPVLWLLSRTVGPPMAMVFLRDAGARVFKPEEPVPGYLVASRAALVLRPDTLLANVQDLVGLPSALAALSPRYGTLRVPTTVVSGADDPIVKPDLQAKRLAQAIPHARLVLLPATGHMLHYTQPEALADAVAGLAAPRQRPEPEPAGTR